MYCRRQLVKLDEGLDRIAAAGGKVVAVSSDDLETSAEFAYDEELVLTLAVDPELKAIDAWGVRHRGKSISVPAIFVVDKDGIIRWSRIGENVTDRPDLEQILQALDRI